jgi:hypothetical protein
VDKYSSETDEELASKIGKIMTRRCLVSCMIDTSTLYIINVIVVNSIDEAKDLTQDVFLHVFINW